MYIYIYVYMFVTSYETDTFTTKACGETFKIQSGILN